MRPGLMIFALLLMLGSCGAPPKAAGDQAGVGGGRAAVGVVGGEAAIVLDSQTILRIGLRTVPLARSAHPPEIELPALVVDDPGAGSAVRTGVAGRLTEAAGRGWPHVGEWLDAGTPIAQVGDARPIVVPRGGTVVQLLAQPGELVQPGQELLRLVDYGRPLARVTLDPPEANPPGSLTFSTTADGSRLTGVLDGPAPEGDPLSNQPAWLYRLPTGSRLRPGTAIVAHRPDPHGGGTGILIPSEAVVQWDALAWAFVERAPGRFVRVRVPTELAVPGGWIATQGFSVGDRVVTTGAGQLLSEEFRARITVGQEVGE